MNDRVPLFSILTGTRNRAPLLEVAIQSVLAQDWADYEHIVIDAVSTDETPRLLASHPHLRVICEPDRGLFDALHKGLRIARGEIIGFLNSDDVYPTGAFSAVAAAFEDPAVDVVTGHVEFFTNRSDGGEEILEQMTNPDTLRLSVDNMLTGNPVFNTRFFRRRFLERVGQFDLDFPIGADREWLLRAALANPRQTVLPSLVYRYREHPGSLTIHRTDRNVLRWRAEHVMMGDKLLREDLTPDARTALRRFHTRESAALAVNSLFSCDFSRSWQWALRGTRQNPGWILYGCQRLIGHMLGY